MTRFKRTVAAALSTAAIGAAFVGAPATAQATHLEGINQTQCRQLVNNWLKNNFGSVKAAAEKAGVTVSEAHAIVRAYCEQHAGS